MYLILMRTVPHCCLPVAALGQLKKLNSFQNSRLIQSFWHHEYLMETFWAAVGGMSAPSLFSHRRTNKGTLVPVYAAQPSMLLNWQFARHNIPATIPIPKPVYLHVPGERNPKNPREKMAFFKYLFHRKNPIIHSLSLNFDVSNQQEIISIQEIIGCGRNKYKPNLTLVLSMPSWNCSILNSEYTGFGLTHAECCFHLKKILSTKVLNNLLPSAVISVVWFSCCTCSCAFAAGKIRLSNILSFRHFNS